MRTLKDAWSWYEGTRHLVKLTRRLADRYWERLPWEGLLERDNAFRSTEADDIIEKADLSLREFDDIAVLVLFSVFESIIRDQILAEVKQEAAVLRQPALKLAAEETIQRVGEGSFFRVLEPFKAVDAGLIEEVNQVRRYRNWVAHGKRGDAPPFVEPGVAYRRLSQFLLAFRSEYAAPQHDWVI